MNFMLNKKIKLEVQSENSSESFNQIEDEIELRRKIPPRRKITPRNGSKTKTATISNHKNPQRIINSSKSRIISEVESFINGNHQNFTVSSTNGCLLIIPDSYNKMLPLFKFFMNNIDPVVLLNPLGNIKDLTTSETLNESDFEPASEPANESMNESVNRSTYEPINELMVSVKLEAPDFNETIVDGVENNGNISTITKSTRNESIVNENQVKITGNQPTINQNVSTVNSTIADEIPTENLSIIDTITIKEEPKDSTDDSTDESSQNSDENLLLTELQSDQFEDEKDETELDKFLREFFGRLTEKERKFLNDNIKAGGAAAITLDGRRNYCKLCKKHGSREKMVYHMKTVHMNKKRPQIRNWISKKLQKGKVKKNCYRCVICWKNGVKNFYKGEELRKHLKDHTKMDNFEEIIIEEYKIAVENKYDHPFGFLV